MRTNIEIDEELVAKAMKALNAKTKKEAVNRALEYVVADDAQIKAQSKMRELRGVGWTGDLDEMRR